MTTMVKVSVVVSGKELQTPIHTSYEVSVFGKIDVIIFFKGECTDLLCFNEKSQNDYKTVLFTGKEIHVVFGCSNTIAFVGDLDKITFVSPNGDIVSTYKINDCDAKNGFTEVS